MAEPVITINGIPLTNAQAMTVRVAIESFASELVENGLGDDEMGKLITSDYLSRITEIRKVIFKDRLTGL